MACFRVPPSETSNGTLVLHRRLRGEWSEGLLSFMLTLFDLISNQMERSPGLDQIIEYGLLNTLSSSSSGPSRSFRIQAHINSGVGILRFRSCGFWRTSSVERWTQERHVRFAVGPASGMLVSTT